MLISETHFTNKSYLKIPNYIIYDTQHPSGRAHGGTALIIKSSIKHFELEKNTDDFLQATSVVAETCKGPITFSAIYCPPGRTIKQDQFTKFFQKLGPRFIAGGDFNAKHPSWGSRSQTPSPRGRQLYNAMQENNLKPASSGEPTYWPSDLAKTPDLIDFFISKGISTHYISVWSSLELTSDHSPIIMKLCVEAINNTKPAHLGNKKTNWLSYKEYINENLTCNIPLKTHNDVDTAVENLNLLIHKAIYFSTPPLIFAQKTFNLPTAIQNKIREKRKLKKIWQNTRNSQIKTRLNKAIKELKTLLRDDKNEKVNNYLKNLAPTALTDYSLWKATKYLNRPQQFIPPIKTASKWVRSDQEKAENFAEHLSKVFDTPARQIPEAQEEILLQDHQLLYEETQVKNATLNEIQGLISYLKNRKSPGYDEITSRTLKELPPKALRYLTILINACLRLKYFPSQWKVAQIILIPKPGKPPELTTSYRPISLLPICAKLFEKVILSRLKPILQEKKLIPGHQFGFRENHSTIEQVNRIVAIIRRAFERKQYCSAIFLDVAQAFDKVWHTGLLHKIKKNLPYALYQILKSYLENRTFQVKVNNEVTKLYDIHAGVPQGSVLGPTLYLLYTSDIPSSQTTTTATYVDDTALLSTHTNPIAASTKLQNHLTTVVNWFKNWRIKINENKSAHITFTLCKDTCPTVLINGTPVAQFNVVKYLGIHLDRRLTWRTHLWTKRKQLNYKFRKMYWLLGRNSVLTMENKLLLYKSILKPIWTYGIQLWGAAAKSNLEIIERFQSKVLRNIVNVSRRETQHLFNCF
ncbi:hypothetical protein TKK_0014836 [Trichogramma kaykai]